MSSEELESLPELEEVEARLEETHLSKSVFPPPPELGLIPHKKPSIVRYATFESRLRSFVHWPRHIKQRPKDLALAGWFYTGRADRVQVSIGRGVELADF